MLIFSIENRSLKHFFLPVQLQIEEISRKLRTGDLGIAQNPEERFVNYFTFQRMSLKTLREQIIIFFHNI